MRAVPAKQVRAWCAEWGRLLQLSDWQVEVYCERKARVKSGSNKVLAFVEYDWETRRARVSVATCRPAEEVRMSCLHEMLHLASQDLEQAGNLAAQAVPDEKCREVLASHVSQSAERLVHRLERAIKVLLEES